MKVMALSVIILLLLTFLGCKKESANQQIISIPNGDFEQ